jgi:putative DNA primase/helicase
MAGKPRHKWAHPEPHRYVCERCGMQKRNIIEPDGSGWYQTFEAPGEQPVRSKHVPPCPGRPAGAAAAAASTSDLAAAAFAAADKPQRKRGAAAGGNGPGAGAGTGLIGPDGRRTIRVVNGELPRIVDEAEAALSEQGAGLFQHGTRLVRVGAWDSTGRPSLDYERQQGAAVLFEISPHWLLERLCRCADWEKWDGRTADWVRIDAPRKVADTLLSRQGEWRFPWLTGFCESPTLTPGGEVLRDAGYDPGTGLYLTHDLDLGNNPIESDPGCRSEAAEDACAVLAELVSTFPFVSDADRSAALALMMTAVLRRVLPSAPMGGISASTPATGKSLLADCIALVSTGREPSVANIGPDETETEKRVDTALMTGDSVVVWDNIERAWKSATMCMVLTQRSKVCRVLGLSKQVEAPTNVCWLATGNNLTFLGDLTSRVLLVRLDAGVERPEERTFGRDAREHVLRHRAEAVRAVLTIAKAYIDAGSPMPEGVSRTRFGLWDRMVRFPLIWAGQADPLGPSRNLRDEDHEQASIMALLEAWHAELGDQAVTASQLWQLASEREPEYAGGGPKRPGLHESIVSMLGDVPRGGGSQALGYKLRKFRGRIFGNRLIEQDETRVVPRRWRVVSAS